MYFIKTRYGITISSLDHSNIEGFESQYFMNLSSHIERYTTLVGSPLYFILFWFESSLVTHINSLSNILNLQEYLYEIFQTVKIQNSWFNQRRFK